MIMQDTCLVLLSDSEFLIVTVYSYASSSVLMFPKVLSWVLFGLPCTCFLLGVVSHFKNAPVPVMQKMFNYTPFLSLQMLHNSPSYVTE